RAPASRINAIASIAQSQRLSGSNRATFTKVGRSPNASRSGRASAGGSGFKKRSAMPFGRTAASTPTADISARMKRETVVIDAASFSALLARRELRIADEEVVDEVAAIDERVGQVDHARGETADERIAVGAFEGDEDHVIHGRARIMARAR